MKYLIIAALVLCVSAVTAYARGRRQSPAPVPAKPVIPVTPVNDVKPLPPVEPVQPEVTPDDVQPEEVRMLMLVNMARKAAGLPLLIIDRTLQLRARRHSEWMHSTGRMVHSSDPGAENISTRGDTNATFNGWMNSSGHRTNMMGRYTRAGVAVSGAYWTLQLN